MQVGWADDWAAVLQTLYQFCDLYGLMTVLLTPGDLSPQLPGQGDVRRGKGLLCQALMSDGQTRW